MIDRVHRELTDEDIQTIADTYHAWRGEKGVGKYKDIAGFSKSVKTQQICEQSYILTPGRYVGADQTEEDEPFATRIGRLSASLRGHLLESAQLGTIIRGNLESLGDGQGKSWFVAAAQGIPKGWRLVSIRELATNIQYGLTQSASEAPVGPRFLRITDIQGGRVDWSTVPFCAVTPAEHDRYRLKVGDVLVARTGASTGENVYLPATPDAVFASYLVRFQFTDLATARFVGAYMRTQAYFDYVAGCIGGSAQPNASAQVLAGAQLALPPMDIIREFAEFVAPLDKRLAAISEESRNLVAMRDAMFPKLLLDEKRNSAA